MGGQPRKPGSPVVKRALARPLLGEPGCTRLRHRPCDHFNFHMTISEWSEPFLYRLFEGLRLGLHFNNGLHDK